jgi:hypothetical protein
MSVGQMVFDQKKRHPPIIDLLAAISYSSPEICPAKLLRRDKRFTSLFPFKTLTSNTFISFSTDLYRTFAVSKLFGRCTKQTDFLSSLPVTIIYKCTDITTIYKHIYIKNKQIYKHQSYESTLYVWTQKLLKVPSSLELGLN